MKRLSVILFFVTLLPLLALAQERQDKWQVEASFDYMTHGDHRAIQVLFIDGSEIVIANGEKNTFYFAATRLDPITGRLAVRYGISFSDKGYLQDYLIINPNTEVFWRMQTRRQHYYVGVPLLVSFNTLNPKRRLSAFAEAGIIPEILVAYNKRHEVPVAEVIEYDFRRIALSGMVSVGLQYKMSESLTLLGGPQVRMALMDYDNDKDSPVSSIQIASGFRPFSIGFALGLRF